MVAIYFLIRLYAPFYDLILWNSGYLELKAGSMP